VCHFGARSCRFLHEEMLRIDTKQGNFRVEIRFTHFRVQALKINFFSCPVGLNVDPIT
jgi:hypothetical protein